MEMQTQLKSYLSAPVIVGAVGGAIILSWIFSSVTAGVVGAIAGVLVALWAEHGKAK